MAAKEVKFSVDARDSMLHGMNEPTAKIPAIAEKIKKLEARSDAIRRRLQAPCSPQRALRRRLKARKCPQWFPPSDTGVLRRSTPCLALSRMPLQIPKRGAKRR